MIIDALAKEKLFDEVIVSDESWEFGRSIWSLMNVGRVYGHSTSITESHSGTQQDDLKEQFDRLAAVLHEECAFLSSMDEVAQHPAYRQIVEMGGHALPLILKELEQGSAHWFCALHEITRENPVLPKHRGYIKEMAQDWLDWARRAGLRW